MYLREFILLWMFSLSASSHFEDEGPCNKVTLVAFTGVTGLTSIDQETKTFETFTTDTELINAIAIASDQTNGYVFFTDVSTKEIWRTDFKTSAGSQRIRRLSGISVPDGIAVDPVLRQVFYTDTGEKIIARMNYDGSNYEIVTRLANLDEPRGIVLDAATSTMYYTDWGANARISSLDYNGNNAIQLANTNMHLPNDLTVDFANGKLYWCDAGLDYIAVMNTDGSDRRTLFSSGGLDYHFFAILLDHDELLVSDWSSRVIYSLPLDGPSVLTNILTTSFNQRPNGIAQICIPTEPGAPGTTTTSTAAPRTTTSVAPTDGNARAISSNRTEDVEISQTTIIIIAMSIVGALVAITIISVTIWCCLRARVPSNHASGTVPTTVTMTSQQQPPPYTTQQGQKYTGQAPANTNNPAYCTLGQINPVVSLNNYGEYLHPQIRDPNADPYKRESGIYSSIYDPAP